MSGTSDADVNITLTATDQASTTVSSATQNINSQFRAMVQTQNAAGRSFLVGNQSLYAYGRAAQSVGRIVDKGISLFNSYNLMQIRIAQATQTNTDAQENLAEAIAQYGQNSPQAQKAAEAATQAQTDLTKATQQAEVQFALMVASMVAQSGTMITTVIPRLTALAASLKAVNSGSGTLGGGNLGKLGKIAGGVGGAALLAAGLSTGGESADTNTKVSSIGESAIGGAMLGATLGSIVPGIGTAIGAGVGGLAGLAIGTYQNYGQEIGSDIANSPTGNSKVQPQQNTINIIVQDAGAAAKTVQGELSKLMTFSGQPAP